MICSLRNYITIDVKKITWIQVLSMPQDRQVYFITTSQNKTHKTGRMRCSK